ncbi:tRNA 2-thiouridine(34) synthase MnmA [Candidatus Uhrbacteria bacterium]|nr:tRNA 2-thiouridine(34) synthase MnmA [Candidatus Uhrbacteria bacterium]
MPKQRVLLGMSGGVDSSVSAVLLLEQGYEVIGAFMKNWSGSTRTCNGTQEFVECDWRSERRDAMRVAAQLGIEFVTLDFEKEYREKVVENLFNEYEAGRTPNPDVLCNKFVKFDLFVREADRLGCAFVATGHYARVEKGSDPVRGQTPFLKAARDQSKDQTYFLWAMPKEVLPRVMFPVGDLLKSEVREIARKHRLSVAEKKDSMGICFVGEVDIKEFLKERIKLSPGLIKSTDGRVVGEHEGLAFYTIGQREGIGSVGGGTPWYVVRKETVTNTLVVGSEVDPELYSRELTAGQCNWLTPRGSDPVRGLTPFSCFARVRYRQPLEPCHVSGAGVRPRTGSDPSSVQFENPIRAITPGQSIVFYTEDGTVLGGGIIST